MKTIHVFTAFVLIFSCMLISCSKEEQGKDNSLIPANDLKLARMIQHFKARGESHLKSGEEMSVDSALWYLSSAVNFTYGDGSRDFTEFWNDSSYLTIPINSGKISESEIYNKYIELVDNLKSQYQVSSKENKQLISVTVSTQSITTSQIQCLVVATFAYGPIGITTTFNDIDSWSFWRYWAGAVGICGGPNYGQHPESDAAKEMQKRIMAVQAALPPNGWIETESLPNQGVVNITDPTMYKFTNELHNHGCAPMYWNSNQYPDFCGCISPGSDPGELNFYLQKTKELLNTDTENNGPRFVGSSFIFVVMEGGIVDNGNFIIYKHKATIQYGIIHFSGGGPISLE